MNGYQLTRMWYNYKFENPDKVRHIHSDMYFYIIDLWNRLGQKQKIGLPTSVTMDALGIGSRNTYYKTLKELISWGFIKEVQASKNQNQSRIISISACSKSEQTGEQALDQAIIQASEQTTEHIVEQKNKGTIEQRNMVNAPDIKEFLDYCSGLCLETKKDFTQWRFTFESKYQAWIEDGWKDGNGKKIKNWKTKIRNTLPYLKPITNNYGKPNSQEEHQRVHDELERSKLQQGSNK